MNFRWVGLQTLITKLRRSRAELPNVMRDTMKKAVLYVQSTIPPYPPPPFGSTYRRTGTLGRTVTSFGGHPLALGRVQTFFNGVVRGYVGTAVRYAPYVIDEDRQAKVHRGRWYTLQGVVRKARGAIFKLFQQMRVVNK